MENYIKLINELIKLPNETTYIEFKHNNYSPDMIGEDISALANSATLYDRGCAYMIWGVDNKTHDIVGTEFDEYSCLKGKQEIGSWLRELLSKNADFEFHSVNMNEKKVVVLIIRKAISQSVSFKKVEYIRIGSYTKKLNEYPALQAQLWDKITGQNYEEQIAKESISVQEALNLIEYSSYFNLMGKSMPSNQEGILHYLLEEGIILKQDNGLYAITNLGAILFAKKLSSFPTVARKAIRVVKYNGKNRLEIAKNLIGDKGYAIGFEGLIDYLEALLPSSEEIGKALRTTKSAYPAVVIREIVANALIHQELSITGAGPIIEIFDNRLEVTNPGTPLVDVLRIVDNPPKSRNEKLAALMRRMGMCEELGSGWDRIVMTCELNTLPSPKIVLYQDNTKVVMLGDLTFKDMVEEDKLWACYMHACVKYVSGEGITNRSLRERFGLPDTSSASISRLIKDAVNSELIKPIAPDTAPRYMKYVPMWA